MGFQEKSDDAKISLHGARFCRAPFQGSHARPSDRISLVIGRRGVAFLFFIKRRASAKYGRHRPGDVTTRPGIVRLAQREPIIKRSSGGGGARVRHAGLFETRIFRVEPQQRE